MELIDMKNIFLGGWIMGNQPTSSLFPHFPMILSLSSQTLGLKCEQNKVLNLFWHSKNLISNQPK